MEFCNDFVNLCKNETILQKIRIPLFCFNITNPYFGLPPLAATHLDMFSSSLNIYHHSFLFIMILIWVPFTQELVMPSSSPASSVLPQQTNLSTIFDIIRRQRQGVYRVFRIFTRTWEDVQAAQELSEIAKENPEIDFWLESANPGQFADVMISPEGMNIFEHFLSDHSNLSVEITVDDVEKLIFHNEFYPRLQTGKQKSFFNPPQRGKDGESQQLEEEFRLSRRRDQPPIPNAGGEFYVFDQVGQLRGTNYPWGEYTGYSEMVRYLRTLEFYYPHLVQLIQLGTTHEGRSIEGVKVGYSQNGTNSGLTRPKRIFWIDGNMHAREWASGHTALFIINQLVWAFGKDAFLTNALSHLDFIIVPCANPDGFEYSRSSLKPQIRLWRKNRSPEQCTRTAWGGLHCCRGVDLNRNFDFHWAETGSSLSACSNLFSGKKAFSEPEARAIANFLRSDEINGRVDAFITLHTYAQLWIHPFSHEYQNYPPDVAKMRNLALKATSRLREVYGTSYRVGTGADLLAPASGGSDDWAKETLGVKYVYLVELRPQQRISNGFILRQEELLPTAIETFEAIKVIIQAVLQENSLPSPPLTAIRDLIQNSTASSSSSSPNLVSSSTVSSEEIDFDSTDAITTTATATTTTTLQHPSSSTTRQSSHTFITRIIEPTSATKMLTQTTTTSTTTTTTTTTTLPTTIKTTRNRFRTTKSVSKTIGTTTVRLPSSTTSTLSLISGGDEEGLITTSTRNEKGKERMAKKDLFVKLSATNAPRSTTSSTNLPVHSTKFRFTIPSVLTKRSKLPSYITSTSASMMMTSVSKTTVRRREQFREQFKRIQSLIGKGQQRINVSTTKVTTPATTAALDSSTTSEENAQTNEEEESTATTTTASTEEETEEKDGESEVTTTPIQTAKVNTERVKTTTSKGTITPSGTTTTVLDSGSEHGRRTLHSDEIDLPTPLNTLPAITSSPSSLPRIVFVSSLRLLPSPDPFVDFEIHRRDINGRTIKLMGGGGREQQKQNQKTLGEYWRSLFVEDNNGRDAPSWRTEERSGGRGGGAEEQRNIRRKETGADAGEGGGTTKPTKCRDERSSCAFWIRAHPLVCTEQMRYMRRNCALSCGFCTVERSRK